MKKHYHFWIAHVSHVKVINWATSGGVYRLPSNKGTTSYPSHCDDILPRLWLPQCRCCKAQAAAVSYIRSSLSQQAGKERPRTTAGQKGPYHISEHIVITSTKNSYRYCSVRPSQNRCHTLSSLGSSCETRVRGKKWEIWSRDSSSQKAQDWHDCGEGRAKSHGSCSFRWQTGPGLGGGLLKSRAPRLWIVESFGG